MLVWEMVLQFFIVFKDYLIEILPYLALGFFLSGLISEFVPTTWVERHLGGRGIKPLLYATIAGTILPICCIGSLPVAVSFHQKGARLGPVLAFLVATPATSVSALLVTYSLLGIKFAAFIFFAVILLGLIMGLIGNTLRVKPKPIPSAGETAIDPVCGMQVQTGNAPSTEHEGETYYFCCAHCQQAFEDAPEGFLGTHSRKLTHRIKHVLRYAFVDMPKDIGLEILVGIALAAVVAAITPVGEFVRDYFGGVFGYLFSIVFGIAFRIAIGVLELCFSVAFSTTLSIVFSIAFSIFFSIVFSIAFGHTSAFSALPLGSSRGIVPSIVDSIALALFGALAFRIFLAFSIALLPLVPFA